MGQAVKYAALGVAIASILALIAGVINMIAPSEIVSGFGSAITNVIGAVGDFFRNVRGALNYVMGTHWVFTIAIAFWVAVPVARIAYRVVIAVTRFLNQ